MEYEYIYDATTGAVRAKFSLEHQVIGAWLEVELANDQAKLTRVLNAIEQADKSGQEQTIAGQEYAITVYRDEVVIQTNASVEDGQSALNGMMPDHLAADGFDYDNTEQASCGLEDFRECLLTWSRFHNH